MIPSDWEVKTLGELYKVHNGLSKGKQFFGHGYPFLSFSVVFNNVFIPNKLENLVDSSKEERASYSINKGDVFITRTSETVDELGMSCVALKDYPNATYNGFCKRLRPNDVEFVNLGYLGFYLRSDFIREWFLKFSTVTTRASLKNDELLSLPLVLPPTIEEQQRIANALSDVDSLIANLEKLIAKKKNIKQGAMQQLLTGKKRLPGFAPAKPTYKQTELGKIPTDWEVKPLKKIGVFSKGAGISRDESNSGNIPAVRYGEIYTKHNDYIKKFYSHISQDVADKSVKMQKGDLLFSASGETKEDIGKTIAFVDDFDAYAGGDIIIFTPTETIDSIYMGYLLNFPSIAKQKAMKAQGDAVVHITTDSLKKLAVCLPSPQEQTAIANVLSDMDTEISALETKLAKYRTLKTGMMQQLLTGKIRLV